MKWLRFLEESCILHYTLSVRENPLESFVLGADGCFKNENVADGHAVHVLREELVINGAPPSMNVILTKGGLSTKWLF